MHHDEIIDNTVLFVKETLKDAESGHDWFHIERVWKIAKLISKLENCNHFIVEMAALLHDIADSKFHNGNEEIGPELALKYMNSIQIDEEISNHIVNIIRNISFKGGHKHSDFNSIELQIVQDADRIDALGAIGIARASATTFTRPGCTSIVRLNRWFCGVDWWFGWLVSHNLKRQELGFTSPLIISH
jgi:uncharacterized protein